MADKFLNTGQGAVNLTNGTVQIIAAELGAVNLQASKPVKTNAVKQLVSGDLDISDITNLQSELTTKSELNFIENDNLRVTPAAGEVKLYTKTDKHFYKMDDTGDEKQLGNVFSNTMPANQSLAVFQGGSGEHITGSSIIYNQNLSALENVELISNNQDQIFLLPGTIELITSTVAVKSNTDFYSNNITNVATLNGIVPINILQNTGATPMTQTYIPNQAQDIATKTYVDNHNTSGNYVKTDGTSTMTGNLNLGSQNIVSANEVSLNVINKNGAQNNIRVNTNPYLDVSGGDFGSILRLIADESNLNNDSGEIHFYQDGGILSGAVLMNGSTKKMRIVSCGHSGSGGIEFRVGGVSDGPYTSPSMMNIYQSGDVVIQSNLKINSHKVTTVPAFTYYAYNNYGGIASGNVNTALYCPSGRVIAQEFGATSDRRCKRDIVDISDSKITAFMELIPKEYNWKTDDEKATVRYGFIAQDVVSKNLMPCINFSQMDGLSGGTDEITGVNNPEDICLNLNYDSMIPLLQGALKKALDRITILEQKISAMI